jgi:DNA-binding CsgD family transcriptional regulator
VADKITGDYLFTGLHQQRAGHSAPTGSCPACGAFLAPPPGAADGAGQTVNGMRLRAAVPQPMAAALLLARALTPRERTVFQFLGFGYDNRSIARELRISERTVKRYVTAMLTKLKLESRLQAGLTALIISSSSAADSYWPESRMELPWAGGDTVNA